MRTSSTNHNHEHLLLLLAERFSQHLHRHPGIEWGAVFARIGQQPILLESLASMEATGGEPDVVFLNTEEGRITFCDCSFQSPAGRRSICYDQAAQDGRKKAAPKNNAISLATSMGISILTEADYRALQSIEAFDTTTSSWIFTPTPIRNLGGALFCDRRYEHTFTYHNGADSYYSARGFRGKLVI